MVFLYWFPSEIWIKVFQMISEESHYLPRNDLKNLRLTCKIFEELATPFLLPRIICAPLSSSLTTLTAVSRHPVFSRSVTKVVYVCNRYRFIKTLPEYKEALHKSEENMDLNTVFSQYGQYYNDQTEMEHSGEVIACLCSALMRMPNIETITISPRFDAGNYNYSRYFLEPDPAYNEAFLLIARVLSLTGAKIRELNIESDDDFRKDPSGVNGALFRGMSHLNLSHCCAAFRGLRNITITADEKDVNGWKTGNLAKILSEATDLERLCVHGCDATFHISTKYILSTTTWSRLTSLDFLDATLDQGDFLDLLTRHSGTLKNIDLFCVSLTNGSWKILLEGMKSSLSLQHISIYDPYEEDNEERIYLNENALKDYLLGDGPHPLSE